MSTTPIPNPSTMTMFAPDGTTGEIPIQSIRDAQAKGFIPAVTMQSPDGKTGYIPASKVHDAVASGFKMVPTSAPPEVKASYWDALTNPVGSGAHEQGILGGIEQIGGQAIKTMAQPIAHPLDTLSGMYNMVRHPIDTAQGIVQNFQNDRQQGGLPLAIENAGGQLAGTIEGGRAMAPVMKAAINLVPSAAGKALLLGRTPEAAYENALKPSTTLSPAERAGAIQTALQNSIPISKGGLVKLGGLIDDLNQKIANEIDTDPNRPIDPNAVAQRTASTSRKFSNQVNAQPDLDAIEASKQQFLNEQGAQPGKPAIAPRPTGLLDAQGKPIMTKGTPAQPPTPAPPMGAADAQAMKQGTYRVLAGKYGEQGSASVEAQKALARGLKEEIATQFPEVDNLNAAESKLLDLQPILERAVNRVSNHQAIGIGTPVVGSAVATATGSGSIGAVAGILKGVLDNPQVASRLAIQLSKGAKIPYAEAASKVAAYSASLGSAVPAGQGASNADIPNQ